MSLFDSIISVAAEKFGLGDKAGTLLSGLMSMMTDSKTGGFGGFLSRFSDAGLGDVVNSWISSGANTELSNEQVESALGSDAINDLASKAGVDSATASSALGFMVPQVVDKLTPDGVVPDDKDLLSKIGDFLSGWGGAAVGAAAGAVGAVGSMAGSAAGKASDVVGGAAGKAGDAAGAVLGAGKGMVSGMGDAVGDVAGGGGGLLKWLLPLILLGLALLLGLWFCGKGTTPTAPNTNANANANKGNANTGNANANANTATGEKKLGEVALPNGTKLSAYPGGIEDQLVKFITSDEYKNAAPDALKDKWFNFDDLNFKFGSTELAPESKRQLDNIVSILKAFPDVKLKIGAYTDKVGNDAGNLKLSDSRAKAVKAALEKAGVGSQVPEAEGYGEQFAKVDEKASDEERKADRRTAIRLIKGDAKAATAAPANANTGAKPAEANTAKPAEANTAAKPAAAANTNAAANK